MRVFFRLLTALADRRLVGREFGGYALEKVLGSGRFATCFSAQSITCAPGARASQEKADESQSVVMKLVKPRKGRMDDQAVWAECSALQRCDHPGIPEWLGIVNMDESGATFEGDAHFRRKPYFIVQELMSGKSLAHWLRRQRHVFSLEEIWAIALQLADMLHHLEQRGIVHGDIRPANVLYDGSGVSLIDFGLSLQAANMGEGDARVFSIDRDGLASVILFLLYSDRSRIKPGVKASWREELVLPLTLHQLLEDLFNEEYPWEGAAQVRLRVQKAFDDCSCAKL